MSLFVATDSLFLVIISSWRSSFSLRIPSMLWVLLISVWTFLHTASLFGALWLLSVSVFRSSIPENASLTKLPAMFMSQLILLTVLFG